MTAADRVYSWNRWYDGLREEWRFQFVLWPLIALGALNMVLSIAFQFPFGLLVLLGILFFATVRVFYILSWIKSTDAGQLGEPGPLKFEISGAAWLVEINQRYDAIPEQRRFWVFPAILVIAGAINMLLSISTGFPFGLLFLLALLALAAMRAPYTAGLLELPPSSGRPALAAADDADLAHLPPMPAATRHSFEPAVDVKPTQLAPPHEMAAITPEVSASLAAIKPRHGEESPPAAPKTSGEGSRGDHMSPAGERPEDG